MPTIVGTEGNDTFTHTAATDDTYILLGGNDLLTIFGGTVTATLGEGDDVASLRGGSFSVYGDAGADRFEFYAGGTASGGGDDDIFNIRGGTNISAYGDSGDDRFNFAAAATGVLLLGGIGNDDFAGANFAVGGEVYGENGNDLFTGFRSGVTIYGGNGDDAFRVNPVSNATFIEGVGEGNDTVQLMRGADYTLPANIERIAVGTYAGSDLTAATISMNDLANVFTGHGNDETVYGFGGNDKLYGKAGNDTAYGDEGNDILDGGAGNDTLYGGLGNDRLVGRAGDDTMAGGGGNDIYYVDSTLDAVSENFGEGTDTVRTTVFVQLGSNVENGVVEGSATLDMWGNELDNTIHGGSGNNGLFAFGGNDTIYGNGGNDNLGGYGGSDILFGGDGTDTLMGMEDADTLTGGAGDDNFYFGFVGLDSTPAATDQITDFLSISGVGGDKLNVSGIDANTAVASDQAFVYTTATPTANSLWYDSATVINNGDGTYEVTILADVNGDTTPEVRIQIHFLSVVLYPDDLVL